MPRSPVAHTSVLARGSIGTMRDQPMAKKKVVQNKALTELKAVLPKNMKAVDIPPNATVTVDVDVNDMTVPYTIALDGDDVLNSRVDRKKDISPLDAGTHALSWGFAHTAKGWKHKLTLIVNGKATVLEEMSEAHKDVDHSIGVAFLVAR
jgi:hypothetical protein